MVSHYTIIHHVPPVVAVSARGSVSASVLFRWLAGWLLVRPVAIVLAFEQHRSGPLGHIFYIATHGTPAATAELLRILFLRSGCCQPTTTTTTIHAGEGEVKESSVTRSGS